MLKIYWCPNDEFSAVPDGLAEQEAQGIFNYWYNTVVVDKTHKTVRFTVSSNLLMIHLRRLMKEYHSFMEIHLDDGDVVMINETGKMSHCKVGFMDEYLLACKKLLTEQCSGAA
jgi:ribosomal protein S17